MNQFFASMSRWMAVISLAIVVSGCAAYGAASGGYNSAPRSNEYVPQGYMPPAGQCRIWYSDRKPEQQPPVGNCAELERQVPTGARLLRG
ncbi:MAG: hypothetical protein JJU48_04975 [Methylophaga sp.]|nr:hypothetical protein [Methylophaga sp.]